MGDKVTIMMPDRSIKTATRISFHQALAKLADRFPHSTTSNVSGRNLERIANGVIIHSFPQYADEASFLSWLANIKTTNSPLPPPIKLRFRYAKGIAEGKEAAAVKTGDLRFANASDATAVVNHLHNAIVPCWCKVDIGGSCADGDNIKIDCHLACKRNEAHKDLYPLRTLPGPPGGLPDWQKPKNGWYHVADRAYHDDDDEEGGICEWYVTGIGAWFIGDCDENHTGFEIKV